MPANAVGEYIETTVAARNKECGRLRGAERVGPKAALEGHALSCTRGSVSGGVRVIGLRRRIGRRIALARVSCDGVRNGRFNGRRRGGGLCCRCRLQRLVRVRA
eukprot:6213049-Pleurochrysis_carterae.AAC.2